MEASDSVELLKYLICDEVGISPTNSGDICRGELETVAAWRTTRSRGEHPTHGPSIAPAEKSSVKRAPCRGRIVGCTVSRQADPEALVACEAPEAVGRAYP